MFGVTPGRFKRNVAQSQAMMEKQMSTLAAAKPNLVLLDGVTRRGAFTVAGLSARIEANNKQVIPTLWPRLTQQLPVPGQKGRAGYGVCWGADLKEGSFNYMAGVEIEPRAPVPKGLTVLPIPPPSYRAFPLTLDGGGSAPPSEAAAP